MIPARGGSKGIPRKNLSRLAGKPLIQYTFDAAMGSRELGRVLLSTDDREIADLGRRSGVEVPFLRPARLATDTASSVAVVRHALDWVREHDGYAPGAVVLLQPTSPLRRPHDIDTAVRRFRDGRVDSLVSVCRVREHPYEMVRLSGRRVRRFLPRPRGMGRRQQYPEVYWVNGAIYIARTNIVLGQGTLFGARVHGYVMDPVDSVDIDTPLDLRVAECVLRTGRRPR